MCDRARTGKKNVIGTKETHGGERCGEAGVKKKGKRNGAEKEHAAAGVERTRTDEIRPTGPNTAAAKMGEAEARGIRSIRYARSRLRRRTTVFVADDRVARFENDRFPRRKVRADGSAALPFEKPSRINRDPTVQMSLIPPPYEMPHAHTISR